MKQRHLPIQRAGLRILGSNYFPRATASACMSTFNSTESLDLVYRNLGPALAHLSTYFGFRNMRVCCANAYDDRPNPDPDRTSL